MHLEPGGKFQGGRVTTSVQCCVEAEEVIRVQTQKEVQGNCKQRRVGLSCSLAHMQGEFRKKLER